MSQHRQRRIPIAPMDPRLRHLRTNPSMEFMQYIWDYTDHVLDALAPNPGTVVVYSFDGELDDDLRLEHLLLKWSSGIDLIIVAGQRYDGDATYEELKGVILEVLGCKSLPSGCFTSHPNVRLIRGGTLSSLTNSKVDPVKNEALQKAVERVEQAIGARPFVFHNNTSCSLFDKLLSLPVGKQLQGCSLTCSLAAPPGHLFLAANANWDRPAFERILEHAQRLNVPCLAMHGSLAGWKRQVLPELRNWATTMFTPAATEVNAIYARKMVRFGMGVALEWAVCGYASAKSLSGPQTQAVVDAKLAAAHLTIETGRPKPSDGWTSHVSSQEAGFSNRDPARDATTIRAMVVNAGCSWSNTVGDVSGCPLDVPFPKRNKLVILKVESWVDQGLSPKGTRLGHKATIGSSTYTAKGGLYILAHAKESETLDKAWAAIRLTRAARRQGARTSSSSHLQFPILDAQLAMEWRTYRAIFEFFLRGILDNIGIFPASSKAFVELAFANLEKGELTKLCEGIRKQGTSAPNRRGSSRLSQSSLA